MVYRVFLSILALLILSPVNAQEDATEEPDTPSPERYEAENFSIYLPPNATVEETENGISLIVGPEVSIRPAEQDFTVSGAAYRLAIYTFENPDELSSEAWATEQIVNEWERAREEGSPTGNFPITEEGELNQEDVQRLTVDGLDALRVDFFGGDSTIVNIYVSNADQITVFSYIETIIENDPLALVQQDIYALLLHSVSFETNE